MERAKGFFTKLYKHMDEDERYDQALFLQEHKLYMGNIPTYLTEDEVRKESEASALWLRSSRTETWTKIRG